MGDEILPRGALLIRHDSIAVIAEPGNGAHVYPLARLREGTSSASITRVDIEGRHQRLSSKRSTRLYFVVSGELIFHLGDAKPVGVAAGDALEIPRNCMYDLAGTATYLVINTPAFEEGDDNYQT
jgi:mannose-6-phosphate isomerase-like protein (cupin superfamily)